MEKIQETEKKSTSEQLSDILAQLSKDQLRYVVALQDYPNKKDACEAIGIKANTAYKWPDYVDEAARLVALEAADGALAIRRRNLIKAMMVKVAGLDSKDEATRQKAATELIEWELGKAGNKLDLRADISIDEIGVRLVDYRVGITEIEDRPGGDSEPSSQDKSLGDGA